MINKDKELGSLVASTLNCSIQPFPLHYLGIKLRTSKPKHEDWNVLLENLKKSALRDGSLPHFQVWKD